jgi:hypothetical protein
MKARAWLALLVAFAALCGAGPARAEIWGYVEDNGVAHFAAEKVDERYQLFFRGGESFDTAEGVQAPAPVPVPGTSPRKLLAFFDISPGYQQVRHHVREASREHGIDYELLQALIATESGFDPTAVSPKGAVGLMQLMPATAQRYGVSSDGKNPLARKLTDPRINLRAGSRYLRDLIRMFPGQLELALAAYNAGEGAVQRAGNRIPNYRETQNYVKTVLQLYAMLKPPAPRPVAGPAGPRTPKRIRMELGAPPLGGAFGRGNLPAGVASAAAPAAAGAAPVHD